jgi:DNA-binding GntR family transcriptional regulator
VSYESDIMPQPRASLRDDRAPRGSGSVATRLYRRLVADILHGRLEPGQALTLLPLSAFYGTSTNTLREVLIQLTANRLVVRGQTCGFQIAPANQSDLFELLKTVSWIEEIGIRESIANGDRHWEQDVLVAHRALSRCPVPDGAGADRLAEWDEHVLQYHRALVGACRSSILIAHCRELNQHLLRYRNLAARVVVQSECERDSLLAMRSAALERNADRTVELLHSYFKATANIVLTSAVLIQ